MLSLGSKEQSPHLHWGCADNEGPDSTTTAPSPAASTGQRNATPALSCSAQTSCSALLQLAPAPSAKEICLALTFSHMFQMCKGVIVNNVISRARAVCSYRALFPAPQGFQ